MRALSHRGVPRASVVDWEAGVGRASAKVLPALVAKIRQGTEWKDKPIERPRMETT